MSNQSTNPIDGPGKYITRNGSVITLSKTDKSSEPDILESDQTSRYWYTINVEYGNTVFGAGRWDDADIISKYQPQYDHVD